MSLLQLVFPVVLRCLYSNTLTPSEVMQGLCWTVWLSVVVMLALATVAELKAVR